MIQTPLPEPSEEMLRLTCRREHPFCFACGDPADGGLGLCFSLDAEGAVAADWCCPEKGQSYPGMVHGGLIATLLDSAMAHALFARGIVSLTGELRLRFREPVKIAQTITLWAGIKSAHAPMFRMEAELRQLKKLCARAEARFMSVAHVAPHG